MNFRKIKKQFLNRRNYYENTGVVRVTFPGARLLVVDDIATNLKVAEGLLVPYKAEVDTCLSGKQAIELVKQHEYDIVFMDHMMPEMDGIETTAGALGTADYVSKPFDPASLVACVEKHSKT